MYSVKRSWGKKVDTWSENVWIQDDVDVLVDLFNFCLFVCGIGFFLFVLIFIPK